MSVMYYKTIITMNLFLCLVCNKLNILHNEILKEVQHNMLIGDVIAYSL
jgi:hypothetical protein